MTTADYFRWHPLKLTNDELLALALSNRHKSLQTSSSSQGTDKMNKDAPISNQLPNDKIDALRLEC